MASLAVRSYRSTDAVAIADICLRTGNDGTDATGMFADDRLLAAVYADPYVQLEPDLAVVVDDGSRAVGYIIGTADTPRFIERYLADYLPRIRSRFPEPAPQDRSPSAQLVRTLHDPGRQWRPEFVGYPAHLHIDLLPAAQGHGDGRRLMKRFLETLRSRGVPGVHLGVSAANHGALAFYAKQGFHELPVSDVPGARYLGMRLAG